MVKLHAIDDSVVYFNIDKIKAVSSYGNDITDVNIENDIHYAIKETAKEVVELIGEARCIRYVGLAYSIADEFRNSRIGC